MTTSFDLQPGATVTIAGTVTSEMTARAAAGSPGEVYPDVLGTPHLVQHMERAAAAILQPLLTAGALSVGVNVEIQHLAPTARGSEFRSHARFVAKQGKLYWFDVWSEDGDGTIGRGRHSRAIVDHAEIEKRAASRKPAIR